MGPILETQLPPGSEHVITQLCRMDAALERSATAAAVAAGAKEATGGGEAAAADGVLAEPEAPAFLLRPEPVELVEGETAKLLTKVCGTPRPRVLWYHKGQLLVSGARIRVSYDGMMHYLELSRCREYDSGEVRIVARNPAGEVECLSSVKVFPREDWRARLRRVPRPKDGAATGAVVSPDALPAAGAAPSADAILEEVEREHANREIPRSHELDTALKRPRASPLDLRRLEREATERTRLQLSSELQVNEWAILSQHAGLRRQQMPPELMATEPSLALVSGIGPSTTHSAHSHISLQILCSRSPPVCSAIHSLLLALPAHRDAS